MKAKAILLGMSLIAAAVQAQTVDRVLFITLDGVRTQEAVASKDYLPRLWQRFEDSTQAHAYGLPGSNDTMETASIPVSQPSYSSMLAGEVQPCDNNDCGRIQVETFFDALRHRGLSKTDAAVFGSWQTIAQISSKYEDLVQANAGLVPVSNPNGEALSAQQALDNFHQAHLSASMTVDRLDPYTYSHTLHYLEKYQPKLIWMSFNDPDDNAHRNDWDGYKRALTYADLAIDALFEKLEALQLLEKTAVIITTDHGRGSGLLWTSHGPHIPESKQTWAFTFNTELQAVAVEHDKRLHSTLSIRPTIESIL